ncbi:hypothetical protein [uncultured Megasphaera sp.]|nr:hypothetical protein [uncultured Megasphaera sp.]
MEVIDILCQYSPSGSTTANTAGINPSITFWILSAPNPSDTLYCQR